jgi:hypothetical protein
MKYLKRILVVAVGLSTFAGHMALAEGLHSYKIDVMRVTDQGAETPMKDKALTLTVSYVGNRDSLDVVMSAQTDEHGAATITFDEDSHQDDFMNFRGVSKFCGKFDGPHYCAALADDLNTELNGEKLELVPDSRKHDKYNCEIEHNPGFLTDTSTIHVLCRSSR